MSFLCKQIRDAQHARRAAAQLVTLTREKGGAGVEGHAHLDEGQPTVNRRPSILCVQCSASTTSPPPALQSDPGALRLISNITSSTRTLTQTARQRESHIVSQSVMA